MLIKRLCICIALVLNVMFYTSCTSQSEQRNLSTPTTGELRMLVDENFKPIIDSQIAVFKSFYPRATLHVVYAAEKQLFDSLTVDSIQYIIAAREMNDAEKKKFEARKFLPKQTYIAKDAIAIIVHPNNPDSTFTVGELAQILQAKTKSWKDIQASSKLGEITVVFDHQYSGTVRYMIDSLCQGQPITQNIFAAKTNEEVIAYVAQNPAAIGIIGVNWISDMDDPQAQSFLKNVKVAAIAKNSVSEYYKPYQAYIATNDYPFVRKIYAINSEGRNGLGTGFSAFLASDRGQRIILKSGILPGNAPIRLIKTTKDDPLTK